MLELDPSTLTVTEREHLLLWSVVPRPVALVSTVSPEGITNLAPFSYFTAVGYEPMALLYCCGRKPDSSEKDSCRNARRPEQGGTGEFTVNVLVEEHTGVASTAAKALPQGESEYGLVGIHPQPGVVVNTPRLPGSPVAFECRTTEVVPVGDFFVVIGEVVHVSVADELFDASDYSLDLDALNPVGRMGAFDFVRTSDRFVLDRRTRVAVPVTRPASFPRAREEPTVA